MAVNDTGSVSDIQAKGPEGRKSAIWTYLAPALIAGVIAATAIFAVQRYSAQSGEPVVVMDLPKIPETAPLRIEGGGISDIRKSIDSHEPPIKKSLASEDARTLANPPVKSANIRDIIPRAPDAPPEMKKVRLIDPSRPAIRQSGSTRRPLARAPVKALLARTPFGFIPKIANDGRKPFDVYARPVDLKDRPGIPAPARIAIVIGAMGISASGTREAINKLPEEITLAFAPYGQGLQSLVDSARRSGHEIMLQIPMEPFDYPDNDPGPRTLLNSIEPSENVKRLQWLMSRFSGYFGVTNYMGARFTSSEKSLQPIMKWIAQRGLVYLDDGASPRSLTAKLSAPSGLKVKVAQVRLDYGQTPQSIRSELEKLERIAAEQGMALGVGSGMPLTVKLVMEWAKTLSARGIVLVPASAVFR